MSVRLLAGPFVPTANGGSPVNVMLVMWWPGVGLVASAGEIGSVVVPPIPPSGKFPTIMVGGYGDGPDGDNGGPAMFLSLDGTTSYPPPTTVVPGEGLSAFARLSTGDVAQVGGNEPDFPTTGAGVYKASDLSKLSEVIDLDLTDGQNVAADEFGYWYMLNNGSNIEFHKLTPASTAVAMWSIPLPTGYDTNRPAAMAVSGDGLTAYVWLQKAYPDPEYGKRRVHKFSLVGAGSYVGQLSTDYGNPGYQSLQTVPGSTDILVAYNRFNGGSVAPSGALKRYTSSGTVVWTAGLPDGGGGYFDWMSIALGVPGDTHFLAWAYTDDDTYSSCRYVWFDYATGTPDNTRNFAPEIGNFEFDSQMVVVADSIPATSVARVTPVLSSPPVDSPPVSTEPSTGVITLDGRYCDRTDTILDRPGWWPAKKLITQYRVGAWANDGVPKAIEFQHDQYVFVPQPTNNKLYPPNHPLYQQQYIRLKDRCIFYNTQRGTSFRVVVDDEEVEAEGPTPLFQKGLVQPGRSDTDVFVSESGVDPATGYSNSRGVFYDTVTHAWSSPVYHIGMSCAELVYATDYGVLVSRHGPPISLEGDAGGGGSDGGDGSGVVVIMVFGSGLSGNCVFMSTDGTTFYPAPPTVPIFQQVNVCSRLSTGDVALLGVESGGLFDATESGVLHASSFSKRSEYTGSRVADFALACDGAGRWYTLSLNGAGTVAQFTAMDADSVQKATWDITLYPINQNTAISALAVTQDGKTAYTWMQDSESGDGLRTHFGLYKFSLVGAGSFVTQFVDDYNFGPVGHGSMFAVPDGSGDIIVSFSNLNNVSTSGYGGAIKRYTSAGATVWTAVPPDGVGDIAWEYMAPGLPGATRFLAYAYDTNISTPSKCRYTWFDYATGQPDDSRPIAPQQGSFKFDSQFVVVTIPKSS